MLISKRSAWMSSSKEPGWIRISLVQRGVERGTKRGIVTVVRSFDSSSTKDMKSIVAK